MARRVTVIGEAQLKAALKTKAALLAAANAAAVAVEVRNVRADAIQGAPEDSGELRSSIDGMAKGTSGQVRADARHAAFQEFGTSKNAAQPYMGPAAEQSRKRFIGRVTAATRKAVK